MAVMRMKTGGDGGGEELAVAADPIEDAIRAEPTRWWMPPAAMALVAVGAVAAWLIYRAVNPADFVPGSDYAAFGGLFELDLGVERLLEPFSGFLVPSVESKKQW